MNQEPTYSVKLPRWIGEDLILEIAEELGLPLATYMTGSNSKVEVVSHGDNLVLVQLICEVVARECGDDDDMIDKLTAKIRSY